MNSTFKNDSLIYGSSVGELIIQNLNSGKFFMKNNNNFNKSTWIRSITKDPFNRYWIATTLKLFIYDENFRLLKSFPVEEEVNYYSNFLTFLSARIKKGYWWVSKTKLYAFDIKSVRFLYKISNLVTSKFFF